LIILSLVLPAWFFETQAQLPEFKKVDTGAITQLWGGHVSSTCFDMDNDGDQDLFVGNSAVYTHRAFSIYKNEGNGLYLEMPSFINDPGYYNIGSFGDIDNDGDVDLFAGLPGPYLRVYNNNGDGDFQLATLFNLNYSSYYPSLLDFNNDGFLDVLGIDRYGSVKYNNGHGVFTESESLGLFQEQAGVFLHGISWGDPDDDGDFDFYGGYTPSMGGPEGIPKNICYLNDGDGAFEQFDPTSVIVEDTTATTCANWVDYDNDGDMDLYVHNHFGDGDNEMPGLFENLGDMQFTRHNIIDEMYRYYYANSSVWGDLDNDGDLDLYISVENIIPPWGDTLSTTPFNVLYLNEGNGQFTDYLEDHPLVTEDSHTALLFDHDNDGDLDVLLTRYSWSNTGYNNILENQGNDNSWIVLTCEGMTSNKSAIGTRIQVKAFVSGKHTTQTREITPINGHLSYANLRVHFGLGKANVIDTIIIRWPSGIVDTYFDIEVEKFYWAMEDAYLSPVGIGEYHQNQRLINTYPNPLTTSTTLSYTLDKPENVHFTIYNVQGRIVFMMQENQAKGLQRMEWNAEGLPAGMYYFRMQAGDKVGGGKMVKME